MPNPRLVLLASIATLAFAANSLLARLALSQTAIDPTTFSVVRLLSGASFLALFVTLRRDGSLHEAGSWSSALALSVYAVAFSFAYVQLSAGTGALILFGSVQATMLCVGFLKGNRFNFVQWLGFGLACTGVVWLLLPGTDVPGISAATIMAMAGVAWGVYSLRSGNKDPALTSASNFARTVPICLLLIAARWSSLQIDTPGLLYALSSGVVTSGIGYIIWYSVLPKVTIVRRQSMKDQRA